MLILLEPAIDTSLIHTNLYTLMAPFGQRVHRFSDALMKYVSNNDD